MGPALQPGRYAPWWLLLWKQAAAPTRLHRLRQEQSPDPLVPISAATTGPVMTGNSAGKIDQQKGLLEILGVERANRESTGERARDVSLSPPSRVADFYIMHDIEVTCASLTLEAPEPYTQRILELQYRKCVCEICSLTFHQSVVCCDSFSSVCCIRYCHSIAPTKLALRSGLSRRLPFVTAGVAGLFGD